MPDPRDYGDKDEFLAACIPERMDKGDSRDQAIAVCISMWDDADKSAGGIKAGARNSRADLERLQLIHDYAVENGATCHPPSPEESLVVYGGEVKALGNGRVGGYLVRFSTADDPDISPERDFFTPDTDFVISLPAKSPAWFNHALDSRKQRLSHPAELSRDDFGIWAETILDERDEYEKFLLDLARRGRLGWSSGTAAHLVVREPVGGAHRVVRWPLGLDASLTHVPAEPRNQVLPLKSLINSDVSPLADLQDDPPQTDVGGANPMEATMETTTDEIKTLLANAAEEGAKRALSALPPVKTDIGGVVVVKDEADKPFDNPADFFRAVKAAAYYPQSADVRLQSLKATGLSEDVPADGGYLVPPAMASGIISRMYDTNSLLSRISMDSVQGNAMTYNGVDETTHVGSLYGGVIGYWLAEGGTKTASKPKFYQLNLKLKKIAALCYATDELLEDVGALQSWLTRAVPDVLRWYVEEAIVNGDGSGKPTGILGSSCVVTVTRGTASAIALADIANMWSRRYTGFGDYVWLVGPDSIPQLNQMTAATAPIYMPAGNVAGSPFGTLYGRPVIETEHCQALGTAGDIILASLGQYQAIQKGGIQMATSIHVAFATDETAFRFVYRFDGAPTWKSPLTPAHTTKTVSPFVVLSSGT